MIESITVNVFKGFGNVLLNRFNSDLPKKQQNSIQIAHFNPATQWETQGNRILDLGTNESYINDTHKTIRLKCSALFIASFLVQPIGLSLNLLNRISKVALFLHFFKGSQQNSSFKASLIDSTKDLLIVVSTPFILVGMLFSSAYGATLSPLDGRKLYATFERLAYSGGVQRFPTFRQSKVQNYLLAPCFQPEPQGHLGGGSLEESDAW
jgi:hypothetical protein